MERHLAPVTVLSIGLAVLWAVLTVVTAPTSAGPPDRASQQAVQALVAAPPAEAREALPAGFAYVPRVEDGALVNPSGGCSSPVPLPDDFETPCRSHDLGYDLIRHADAAGGTLAPAARQQLDDRFAAELHAVCRSRSGGDATWSCPVWAEVAAAAVRLNSWRQHGLVPGPEDPGSVATGTVGVLALGTAGGSLLLGLRRVAPRVPLPRVSTSAAAAVGLALSLSPSALPHGSVLQGLLTATVVGVCVGATALVRPRQAWLGGHLRAAGVGLAVVVAVAAVMVAQVTFSARRTAIGLPETGPAYWCAVLGVVGAAWVLVRAGRWAWARRSRLRRPAVAVAASVAVLGAAAPVQAAGSAPEAEVLTQDSPFGAVRAHAGFRDGESVRQRAGRAADELVTEGGLTREHVVVVVPTGSGWVNPNLVAGLEERFGDEVATVAVQYDTAPSWWAYLAHREQAEEGAREAVTAVLSRVRALPEDERPQVHVVGESLGATAGQTVFTDEVRRQVCSALWVGSPGGQVAGLPREASVANADDPVVHSSLEDLVVRRDDGRWVPVVSALHRAADFLGSLEVPDGSGHRYGPDIADALPTCD